MIKKRPKMKSKLQIMRSAWLASGSLVIVTESLQNRGDKNLFTSNLTLNHMSTLRDLSTLIWFVFIF